MNEETKTKITEKTLIDFFGLANYIKSKNFNQSNIELISMHSQFDYKQFSYEINDKSNIYTVRFSIFRNSVRSYNCDCSKFEHYNKCEHLACAFHESFDVVEKNENLTIENYYSAMVQNFVQEKKKDTINLDITFCFNKSYKDAAVKLKIGDTKLYSINSKLSSFFSAFKNQKNEMYISKNFSYNNSLQEFSKTDAVLIEYLYSLYNSYTYNRTKSLRISVEQLQYFIKLMNEKKYTIENFKEVSFGFEEGFPYELKLSENNDKFNFKFEIENTNFLTYDNTLAYEDHKLYFIGEKMANFITDMMENSVDQINLSKDVAIDFSKTMTPIVKDKYIIEEKLEDEFKIIKPIAKIYFDFKSTVEAKVIFKYNKIEINYFSTEKVVRNSEFEELVINELKKYGFEINKKKIVLENINKIVDFIETGIFELKTNYEIYTTEKFDKANVVKPSGIKSQFSIGTDNIMTYKFDLDGISTSELNKIFDSMENRKKYFKLRNGQILNTEYSELQELKDICDNLDLDEYSDTGTIPKYRALYLDSVKDYKIVETDNLFDNFIKNFNMYKMADVELTKKDKTTLRDYQLTGVKWLYNIYKCGFGGILADEMGLGKTVQSIIFMKNVIREKPDAKILIVAPTSLIYNWEHEFELFGSELKYKVIANNKEKRIKDLEGNENVFITTYGLLRQDKEIYSEKSFELIIIDEAQNIKNPKAGISFALKSLKSNSKIALTGTPVENSVVEIWSIFDFIMPGYLNNLSSFQSKYNIKNMEEEGKEVLELLTKLISPFILRRKKKDVLVDLPDKLENEIYLDLLPEQKKYYAMQVKKSKEEFEKLMEEEGFLKARFKILQLLTKLRQLCIDPAIVFDNYSGGSSKMIEVTKIIEEYVKNGHKILVFTSFKTALEILKRNLEENGITNYVIDGSVSSKNRNELVNSFNKDNTNVFLITLKSGGTGLNLTSADVVIHLDLWWNPQAENQATDRAHRIGQKNKVEVVKLICKGTIEEKIIELQNKKKLLNDALIENNDVSQSVIGKLDEKDIKDLFKLTD